MPLLFSLSLFACLSCFVCRGVARVSGHIPHVFFLWALLSSLFSLLPSVFSFFPSLFLTHRAGVSPLWPLGALLGWSVGGMLPQLHVFLRILVRFWTDLGVQKAPKIDLEWVPKRSKIECKNHNKQLSLLEPSWTLLGSVLGHFWGELGVKSHWILFIFKWFREHSHFWRG